jgi:hypothetical protein
MEDRVGFVNRHSRSARVLLQNDSSDREGLRRRNYAARVVFDRSVIIVPGKLFR